MALKPKRRVLREPTVFVNKTTGQWVCEYESFDDEGRIKNKRVSFRQKLIREGKKGTLTEQRAAADAYKRGIVERRQKEFNLSRVERNQKVLTGKQLNEAKAAFAILAKLPRSQQSLIDAANCYVKNCRPVDQSPKLSDCFDIFLANYDEHDPSCQYSVHTSHTMHSLLGPFRKYMSALRADIRIGEITEQHVIDFIKSRKVIGSTRQNYLSNVKQFFDRFSSPNDPHRFIEKNPARAAAHYFRFSEPHILKTAGKKKLREVKILQYEQTKVALKIAYEQRQYGILGFAVLATLAGMRPSEIYDLAKTAKVWEDFIRLDEGVIRVHGFGKQSDQRTIDLEPVAVEWLRFIQGEGWPICYDHKPKGRNIRYSNFRALALMPDGEGARYVALRRCVDQQKEISDEDRKFLESRRHHLQGDNVDILRHTYGTNLYYKSGRDLKYVTGQMGNSDEVYYKHYKGILNKPNDFELFFQLTPKVVLGDL